MIANVLRFAISAGNSIGVAQSTGLLLELQPAVAAGPTDERRGASAGRAGIAGEIDLAGTLACEHLAPVPAQQLGDPGQLVLLDQEVRAGPSTLTGGRAPDERRDTDREATCPQRLHFSDRTRHGRHQRQPGEQFIRFSGGQSFHEVVQNYMWASFFRATGGSGKARFLDNSQCTLTPLLPERNQ
jgi:hypothetical protein